MFVLVKDELPIKELDESNVILSIAEDKKTFKILKGSFALYEEHPISMLKHFVLSGEKKNEETD